jgi:hypothetical protein
MDAAARPAASAAVAAAVGIVVVECHHPLHVLAPPPLLPWLLDQLSGSWLLQAM